MASFFPAEKRLREQGFKLIVGIDEVGRGPLAGPVVSAAVILKDHFRLPHIKDSKQLSRKKRNELFNVIIKNSVDYAIAAIPNQIIDEFNILKATQFANDLCIQALTYKPDFALIDGRDKQILDIPFQTVIKGDTFIKSIAAASILAKVFRDNLMMKFHEEFPIYGFDKHVGYATRTHRQVIKSSGACNIHRKSFLSNCL